MTPRISTGVVVRVSTSRAHNSWNSAMAAKNRPAGIHSCQWVGTTAKWMTEAPSEASAASRAAKRLSVFFTVLGATDSECQRHPRHWLHEATSEYERDSFVINYCHST